ncbi:hypothetical protein CCR75_008449 [Bremia lactucae]|uniref:Uncharacterized protein n=1 Tax=Bremia lactucae TaxID=4779 RepID=A0A976FIE3_BRELC|nr:hypothetical protein CCR75_008449 [Bremia lactucae]
MPRPFRWKTYTFLFLAQLAVAQSNTIIDHTPERNTVGKPKTDASSKSRLLDADMTRLESFFHEPIECNYHVLKTSYPFAVADIVPWSGHYWPMATDTIQVLAKKYAMVFHEPISSSRNGVSLRTSIDLNSSALCLKDADCQDDSFCSRFNTAINGSCLPIWHNFGSAWAAAAVLESEPKCAVQMNTGTFTAADIKTLMTLVYNDAPIDVVVTGTGYPDLKHAKEVTHTYPDDAHLNAAFFHIAVANLLGKQKQPFIVDMHVDAHVKSQPVHKYEFVELTLIDAATPKREYIDTVTCSWNEGAMYFVKCTTRLTWIAQGEASLGFKDYHYCLELDDTYAIIGGEWMGTAEEDLLNLLWFPATKPKEDFVTDTGISYATVLALTEESLKCGETVTSPVDVDTLVIEGSTYLKMPTKEVKDTANRTRITPFAHDSTTEAVETNATEIEAPYPHETETPYPHETEAPYPHDTETPYPHETVAPYPNETVAPYPHETETPYPHETEAPYPHETEAPYPHETETPYPHETVAPYPHETEAPYPHETVTPYPHETEAPYPHETVAPYPHETEAPYPHETEIPYPPETEAPCPNDLDMKPLDTYLLDMYTSETKAPYSDELSPADTRVSQMGSTLSLQPKMRGSYSNLQGSVNSLPPKVQISAWTPPTDVIVSQSKQSSNQMDQQYKSRFDSKWW